VLNPHSALEPGVIALVLCSLPAALILFSFSRIAKKIRSQTVQAKAAQKKPCSMRSLSERLLEESPRSSSSSLSERLTEGSPRYFSEPQPKWNICGRICCCCCPSFFLKGCCPYRPWEIGPDLTFDKYRSKAATVMLWLYLILWTLQRPIFHSMSDDTSIESKLDWSSAIMKAFNPYIQSWVVLCTLAPMFYINALSNSKSAFSLNVWALFFWLLNVMVYICDAGFAKSFLSYLSDAIYKDAALSDTSAPLKGAISVVFRYWCLMMLFVLSVMGVLLFRYVV
jgi:hypothetical protein